MTDEAPSTRGQRLRDLQELKVRFRKRRRVGAYPSVVINDLSHTHVHHKYTTNRISTTKYTLWNFIPKNLFEQFRRASNIYFLSTASINSIPSIAPLSPVTSWLPLIFVLSVTAVKEGYEDYRRYVSDKQINNVSYMVLNSNGQFGECLSEALRVGHVVKVMSDQAFPADILLLSTPLDDGACFIETAQLDGETNLKMHKALSETNSFGDNVTNINGTVEVDNPNANLHKFRGKLTLTDPLTKTNNTYSLNERHLMLRGATLRNTPYVIGVVIYTGEDTKLSLNQKKPPSKFSTVERRLNRCVMIIFVIKMILVALLTGLSASFIERRTEESWYLFVNNPYEKYVHSEMVAQIFFSYYVLLSYMIPISLMVTLELVKVSQVQFMEWDEMMSSSEGHEYVEEVKIHDSNVTPNDVTNTLRSASPDIARRNNGDSITTAATTTTTTGAESTPDSTAPAAITTDAATSTTMTPTSATSTTTTTATTTAITATATTTTTATTATTTATTGNARPPGAKNRIISKFKGIGKIKLRGPRLGMTAKTSNLNDELGFVKYVFSDKTGTLTENKMEFSKCSIDGVVYDAALTGQLKEVLHSAQYRPGPGFEPIREFLINMALCHTALPATKNGRDVYQSQSPDEVALCDASKANDYVFKARTNQGISLSIFGIEHMYEVLAVLEFSSDRRRMSIIVRAPDGKIVLYSKGADSVMFARLRETERPDLIAKTQDDLVAFSKLGLRTLVLGYREISPDEWRDWYAAYHVANTSIENREEQVEVLSDKIERNLCYVGVTAIEDRLQDGVPETIDFLLQANIRVWIITGDKQETAINIGYSCKLLTAGYPLIILNAPTEAECKAKLEEALASYANRHDDKKAAGVGMVIDGDTLVFAIHNHPLLFLQVAALCRSVVCCRVTPLQKALVVRLVKHHTKQVCLSIGDGANDVSMIQEANIGIGIFGKEGTQAARASDYALVRFRHLARLLAVHGRYSVVRNSSIIKYSFYKNIAFFFVQFWFSFFNGYSAQTVYDDWVVACYNIFFTSVPPYFMALFEKDIDEDIIMKYPQLYKGCQRGSMFTYFSVGWWFMNGIYHSFLFFFGAYLLFENADIIQSSGISGGLAVMGYTIATYGVFVVILKAALETRYWNWLVHVGIWGSLLVFLAIASVDSALLDLNPRAYYTFYMMWTMPAFYFMFVGMIVAALLVDFSVKAYRHTFAPEDWHVLKERKKGNMPDIDLTLPIPSSKTILPGSAEV